MKIVYIILFTIISIVLFVWIFKALVRYAINMPTWEGLIISALLGILPFYLIMCFFGIMGEKRNNL